MFNLCNKWAYKQMIAFSLGINNKSLFETFVFKYYVEFLKQITFCCNYILRSNKINIKNA